VWIGLKTGKQKIMFFGFLHFQWPVTTEKGGIKHVAVTSDSIQRFLLTTASWLKRLITQRLFYFKRGFI